VANNLLETFVVLGPDHSAARVEVTPTVYEELDRRFEGFRGRLLVARFDSERDWATWEIHPHGDEVVVLLSGAADLVLDRPQGHEVVALRNPGDFAIVPKATWHTARISTPTAMLFVTPGEGTGNAVR
jgi:mannose-6-phosphate isomerase-like protein (cupin superfamily)